MTCPPDLVAFAQRLGDLAGDIFRTRAALPPQVEIKPDGSPVTDTDKAVESAVRAEIARTFPAHGIHGEEFPAERLDAEYVWIIDPLDGTKEWVQGVPLWGFLLGLMHRGEFILGLAEQPLLGHRWLGAAGHGTTRNGLPVHTRQGRSLDTAIVSTMGYDTFAHGGHDRVARLRRNHRNCVTADSFYVLGLLAEGRVDLVASSHFALHDYAALDAIVRHAGGSVTDWQGAPLGRGSDGTILAAGDARLHAEALAVLNR
jgi:inositol-phosphate phosphatase / L-galactose 1-phosphate phosphatase / histidinol-phosphatase